MSKPIGIRLRQVRGSVPREKFAPELGVHKQTLMRYENGERIPDAGFLARMALRYGISSEWLLLGAGPMRVPGAPGDAHERQLGAVDAKLLEFLLGTTEEGLAGLRVRLSNASRAKLVVLLYDDATTNRAKVTREKVQRLIAMLAGDATANAPASVEPLVRRTAPR